MNRLSEKLGIAVPTDIDLIAAAAAAAVVALACVTAWLAGRWAGAPAADFWEKRVGIRSEGLAPRSGALIRYFILWLLLAIALRVYPWPWLATLLLGLAAAGGAALLVSGLARALSVGRRIAYLLAACAFTAMLANAVGGLAAVTGVLDGIGFPVGSRRFTLLALIQILIILTILYGAVRLANRAAAHSLGHAETLDPAQRLLAQKLAGIAILAAAFFIGIDLIGIDLTALAVFGGALGLAVGFGLQKTVGNLFAGIILLMDRSIKPGDVISVGESFGSVNKIGVRAVSIVTRDGKEYLIPNELLMTQEVVNWSYSSRDVRISIPVGIGYDCDVDAAQALMVEAAGRSARVLASPPPSIWTTAFGPDAIEHEIRVWIRDPEAGLGSVRSEILNRLLQLFRENGISIPFPQRDLHVREWPAANAVNEDRSETPAGPTG